MPSIFRSSPERQPVERRTNTYEYPRPVHGPDEDAPASTESFEFVTVRPPRQVAADPSSASINLWRGKSSLAASLRKIAAMRVGLRHILRRPGERLWMLLHAQSLLNGRGSTAEAIALAEDDYRRLAARQQETRAMCSGHRAALRHEHAAPFTSRGKGTSP